MRRFRKLLRISYKKPPTTKNKLPTRKSVPRSSRQSEHTKTSFLTIVEKRTLVSSCLTFIGSGQNHLARHSERGKKTRQTEEEVGDGLAWSSPSPRGQWRIEKKWRKLVIKSSVLLTPTTIAVRGRRGEVR